MSLIDKTVPRLSTLLIDADKDWLGYKIKNLGSPTDVGDALRLPLLRSQLEYPTVDVDFAYLALIGKTIPCYVFNSYADFAHVTVDVFTDKAVEGYIVDYRGGLEGRWNDMANHYDLCIDSGAVAADHILRKCVAGTVTNIASEAVDVGANQVHHVKLSILGMTLKGYRDDMTTAKISATIHMWYASILLA
jgi:hypothetical protein